MPCPDSPNAGAQALPPGGALAAAAAVVDPNAITQAKLSKPLVAQFEEAPLADVLAFIENYLDVEIYVDQRMLANFGATLDATVNLRLRQAPAEMVLELVLQQSNLAYYVRSGVIVVTTPDVVQATLTTRVYPVSDLATPPDVSGSLSDLIQRTVAPRSWEDYGGDGTIRGFRGTLVVTQNAVVHRQIEDLLRQLRTATAAARDGEPARQDAAAERP